MEMVNTIIAFFMSTINQLMGWINKLIKAVVPGGKDAAGKSNFVKYGFILLLVIAATKIFRINLGIGGRK